MNRLGVDFADAVTFIKRLSLNNNFSIDGIYTHFATSDEKGSALCKTSNKKI